MNLRPGVAEFVAFTAMYLVLAFLIRQIVTTWPDSPAGKALAYLH